MVILTPLFFSAGDDFFSEVLLDIICSFIKDKLRIIISVKNDFIKLREAEKWNIMQQALRSLFQRRSRRK